MNLITNMKVMNECNQPMALDMKNQKYLCRRFTNTSFIFFTSGRSVLLNISYQGGDLFH